MFLGTQHDTTKPAQNQETADEKARMEIWTGKSNSLDQKFGLEKSA
jgi:hypothetical protein